MLSSQENIFSRKNTSWTNLPFQLLWCRNLLHRLLVETKLPETVGKSTPFGQVVTESFKDEIYNKLSNSSQLVADLHCGICPFRSKCTSKTGDFFAGNSGRLQCGVLMMPFKFQALWGSKIQTRWSNTAPNMVSEEGIFLVSKIGASRHFGVTYPRGHGGCLLRKKLLSVHTHQTWPNTQTLKHHWGELYAFAYLPTIISFQVYKEFMGVIAISSLTACFFHLSLPCAAEIDWFGIIYPGRSKVHPSSHSESRQGLLVEHIRGPQVIFT